MPIIQNLCYDAFVTDVEWAGDVSHKNYVGCTDVATDIWRRQRFETSKIRVHPRPIK